MEFLSLLWIRRSKTPREVPWTPAVWGAFQRQPSGQPLPCARSVPGVWHRPEAQLKQGHRGDNAKDVWRGHSQVSDPGLVLPASVGRAPPRGTGPLESRFRGP